MKEKRWRYAYEKVIVFLKVLQNPEDEVSVLGSDLCLCGGDPVLFPAGIPEQ